MKFTKYRFIAIGVLLLATCFLGQTVYAAERIVQLNIPGCAS